MSLKCLIIFIYHNMISVFVIGEQPAIKGVQEWDWGYEQLFMSESTAWGYKQRSCPQSHSWTPSKHHYMIDHDASHAIILQIHSFDHPKSTRKSHHFYCRFSPFLQHINYRKIGDLIGMYHSKQRSPLCVCIRLGALQQYSRRISNFSNTDCFWNIISFLQSNIPSSK